MKKGNWVQVVISLLIAVVIFIIAFIILQWALVIAALLSLGCYIGLSFLLAPAFRIGGVNIEHIKNSEEIISLLEEGERDLASIKTIMDASKDRQIKANARNVYREGGKIVEYIKKNPAKAVMARRFFNYYLDKAEEILKKYENLISAGIETDHLKSLKEKTLSALESISRGMVSQFSKLISSEVIDIEADIKLLESTVRMEDS
ncbi:MAG: 5-bromo-4-chloroindolyl phosphate hydrolysis family protein [Treponema sp.]|nr:5-bromo-4-chloroindolyl phosphate hydrolysis family protein [Treponema sp.]